MEKNQKKFEKIIKDYIRAKKTIVLIEDGYGDLIEKDQANDFERTMRFIKKNVEITLQLLDDEARLILENEFLSPKKDAWWSKDYSKSTFYRYRSKAIADFIELYSR